jgi:hypothetical protein
MFEVGFTTCLRFVDGFRNLPWTIGFLASVTMSMALLEIASRSIPMGTAYAVWGGIGALARFWSASSGSRARSDDPDPAYFRADRLHRGLKITHELDEGLSNGFGEALEPLGRVTMRKMMGGATLYLDGVIFAIMDEGRDLVQSR